MKGLIIVSLSFAAGVAWAEFESALLDDPLHLEATDGNL